MGYDKSLFEVVRHPLKMRNLTVVGASNVTPHMRRVRLAGVDLDGFTSLAPEDHVKLFFPVPGATEPVTPMVGPFGIVARLGGQGRIVSRDYTPLEFDAARRELTIEFFLHGQGAASSWARDAREGQTLGVLGPRGSYMAKQSFEWQLLVGDETALPEMSRRLTEVSPETTAIARFLVADQAEQQTIASSCPLDLGWVHRSLEHADSSLPLVEAVKRCTLPESLGFCWIAGEAVEVAAVYRHLVLERGLPRERVHASGHWKRGTSNHDHHEAIAV